MPDDDPKQPEQPNKPMSAAEAAGMKDDDAGETDVIRASDIRKAVAEGGVAIEPDHPDAKSLDELLKESGNLPAGDVVEIAKQIVAELDLVWDAGTFHNSLRPGCIVVWGDDAKRLVAISPTRAKTADRDPIEEAQYIPPELLDKGSADGRGDIFVLGVILYRLLSGRFPFEGTDTEAIKQARLSGRPKSVLESAPDVPKELDEFVSGLLAPLPDFRYPNPGEVLRDLGLLAKAQAEELMLDSSDETDAMELDLMGQSALMDKPPADGIKVAGAKPGGDPDATDFYAKPPAGADAEDGTPTPAPAAAPAKKPESAAKDPAEASNRGLVIGLAAGAAVLVVALGALFAFSGGDEETSDGGVAKVGNAPTAEQEAATLYDNIRQLVNDGDLQLAETSLDDAEKRFGDTSVAPKFAELRALIAQKRVDAVAASEEKKRREAEEKLATEAKKYLADMSAAFEMHEYKFVVDKGESVPAEYAVTDSAPLIKELKDKASRELRKLAAQKAKKERAEQLKQLLVLAGSQIDRRDFTKARDTLQRAEALGGESGVAKLQTRLRQEQLAAKGDAAAGADKLKDALALYGEALALGADRRIEASRAAVLKTMRSRAAFAKGRGLEEKAEYAGALEAYRSALTDASGADEQEIRQAIAGVRRKLDLLRLVADAEKAIGEERWEDAATAATGALKIMPEHENAMWILKRARRKIGPAKSVATSVGVGLVLVPAGEFMMGSSAGDPDESPQHTVYLDAFYMGENEITNEQYEAFDPSHKERRTPFSPDDDSPVVLVSWHDAARFCTWLSEKEGATFALPTEAQFERAARGADSRMYPWGSEKPADHSKWPCNIAPGRKQKTWGDNDGHKYAAPVGSYPAYQSPFGVNDLAGNVWEWCRDWYSATYYGDGSANNPAGPSRGKQRVLRGGSFANDARAARSSNRTAKGPNYREASVGFRVVRTLEDAFSE